MKIQKKKLLIFKTCSKLLFMSKQLIDCFNFTVFEDKPDLPPSPAQAAQKSLESSGNFMNSIRRLLTNRGYVLLLLSYGINVGVFYALSTLLNRVILIHFPVSK